MTITKGMFTSRSDEWETPPEVFDPLRREFGPFDLDVAATKKNAKAPKFFTKKQDGLKITWWGRVWMNPPYGRAVGCWINRAYLSVKVGDASLVVCLVPARTDTAWFHDFVLDKAEIRFIRGRVGYLLPGKKGRTHSPFPSMIVIYRAKR